MKKSVIILGSTGSIGSSALKVIKNNKNFKVKLLSTNKNVKKILSQAIYYNVKDVIINDKISFQKNYLKLKKKGIKSYLGFNKLNKILKSKTDYCINGISGIDGLDPTLKIIPNSKNILIANKESIICGWHIIKKKLIKFKTNFIPIDSEHYSIWKLLKNENNKNIDNVILTASGGPFLKKKNYLLGNIKPKFALKHPNWKMGKKISIDSATMMNKVFELIEAKKIFNLNKKQLAILIHPSSFVHAIIYLKGEIIKFLAHEAKMTITISNALKINNVNKKNYLKKNLTHINNLNFLIPNKEKFPLLSIINKIPDNDSYFETILITINDELVYKYLNNEINYKSLQLNIIRLIKSPYFYKFYKLKPNNVYDIKKIILITKKYLNKNIKYYE